MKKLIAKTDLYSLEIDMLKNRAYLTFTGYCSKASDMPNYLDDIKKATQGLRQGFTLLTDVTEIKTPPKEVEELHVKSQQIWIESGLRKTAEILPASTVAKMALDRWSKITGMEKDWFDNKYAAEAWLDGK